MRVVLLGPIHPGRRRYPFGPVRRLNWVTNCYRRRRAVPRCPEAGEAIICNDEEKAFIVEQKAGGPLSAKTELQRLSLLFI